MSQRMSVATGIVRAMGSVAFVRARTIGFANRKTIATIKAC